MSSSLVYPQIDAAIEAFETGGNPNSAAALANNPGALTAPNGILTSSEISAGATGTVPVANGQYLAKFPTYAQGQQAEDNLVGYYAGQGDTLSQLITNWSVGPNGTPTQTTQSYINSVSAATGLSPDSPVSSAAQGSSPQSGTVLNSGSPAASTSTGDTSTTPSTSIPAWLTNLSLGQIGAFILGLLLIVGAVFLLGKTEIARTAREAV